MGVQAVQAAEPIARGPGDSAISFDDLESAGVSSQSEAPDVELPNAVDQPEKKEKTEKVEPKAEPEDKDDAEKDEKPDAEKSKDDKLEKAAKDKAAAKNPATKPVKYKLGDVEAELSPDALFEVPVRGKKEAVSLKDLTAEYSGKTDWGKKYSELNKERQTFDSDRETLHRYVDELHETLVSKKDVKGALWMLTEAMGGDPVEVISQFQEQLIAQLQKTADMTEIERKNFMLEERESLRKRQGETASKTKEAQKVQNELNSRVEKVMADTGMDKGRFLELYQQLKATGTYSEAELTPEFVGQYHANQTTADELEKHLGEINPKLDDKRRASAAKRLVEVMQTQKLTIEELREVAVEVYGDKQAQNLAKKLKKSQPTQTSKSAKTDNPVSFDDLD